MSYFSFVFFFFYKIGELEGRTGPAWLEGVVLAGVEWQGMEIRG
jgi:hypothetical protein